MWKQEDEPKLTFGQRVKYFFAAHWRGVLLIFCPLLLLPLILPLPAELWQWCALTLVFMALFWVTEVIPLAVTGFMPIMIFPLSGVMNTDIVCSHYMNDSVLMFLGSLLLAYSVEQSGLHVRMALASIRAIGYSHIKLLFAMGAVTMFVSMWITNTAATTMMVPIVFAILRVFENEGILRIYEPSDEGKKVASDISACYFCHITFSATVGGTGTLVGTATNLVFKNLFMTQFKNAPEYLAFPKFCLFSIPRMLILELHVFACLAFLYLGWLRPKSEIAKSTKISDKVKQTAKETITERWKSIGKISYWEWNVIILFGGAIVSFFCRSPQVFPGWGDVLENFFDREPKFIKDSALAMFVAFLMFLLPSNLHIFKNCTAKFHEDLTKDRIVSVLNWKKANADMPWAFMFLLGGGTALAKGAGTSGLNDKLGEYMGGLRILPNELIVLINIIVVVFVTNFASNVATINVFGPIAMTLAATVNQNPFYYIVSAGFAASYDFMIPVGTPGNLIVQSAAGVPTSKMIKAGFGPTIACIYLEWLFILFYGPIVWPILHEREPEWIKQS